MDLQHHSGHIRLIALNPVETFEDEVPWGHHRNGWADIGRVIPSPAADGVGHRHSCSSRVPRFACPPLRTLLIVWGPTRPPLAVETNVEFSVPDAFLEIAVLSDAPLSATPGSPPGTWG